MKLKAIMKTEKGKNIVKKGLIAFAMLAFFVFYYKNLQTDLYGSSLEARKYLLRFIFLGGITFILSVCSLCFIDTKKKQKMHKHYFIVAMILGICYLFVMPLFTQSDEPAHYLRAYELSEGYFITPYYENDHKNSFDKSIVDSLYNNDLQTEYKKYDDMLEISKIQVNKEEKEYLKITANNYSFVNYIPHILGLLLGKLLQLNPYFCGLIGRFFSLLFCVSLVSLGIKILPKGKYFAFILLLSPTFLSYSAAFSADGTTIAYSFLFMSYILSKIKSKNKCRWQDYFLLSLLVICTSLAKIVYLPFAFLILFLPKECFKNRKQEIGVKILLIGLGIFANLGWQECLKIAATTATVTSNASGTNTWIIAQPIRYAMVVLNTIMQNGYNYLENIFAGEFLCNLQVSPYPIINFGFIIINLLAYLSEEKNEESNFYKTIFVFFIIASIFILICTAMYFCTYEGARVIVGIQGRYFFPLVCALLFLKVKNPIKTNQNILAYITICLNYVILLEMIMTFLY